MLGQFDSVALAQQTRLQFLSGTVQPVLALPDGTILIGGTRVVSPNTPARNGVLHVINEVLNGDISINSSAVITAAKMGDFGPFNKTKARPAATSLGCVIQLIIIFILLS